MSTASSIKISVCVPAYGRPAEFEQLLSSFENLLHLPFEILVCEDNSQERAQLRSSFASFKERICLRAEANSLQVRFIENPVNLGYDGNLRRLIELAKGTHVFFIGNDDYVLPNGIQIAQRFLEKHQVLAASRSFARFHRDPNHPIGYSRQLASDMIINRSSHSAGLVLRIGGFFGGLVFDRPWALQQSTLQYDGTLYYQVYLLLQAYCKGSIGYMATPTVAARADNAPLFGSAETEKSNFTPGRYSAKSRGRMWESILRIAKDAEEKNQILLLASIRNELKGRMSFHLFEMFAGRSKQENRALRQTLIELDLYEASLPKILFYLNICLGSFARTPYKVARLLLQR